MVETNFFDAATVKFLVVGAGAFMRDFFFGGCEAGSIGPGSSYGGEG